MNRRDILKLLSSSAALGSLPISFSALSEAQILDIATNGYLAIDSTNTQFEGSLVPFNQRWKASNCEVIYLCMNAAGVQNALSNIVTSPEHKNAFSIKSAGHCYEDYVFNDNIKAIIDVSNLKSGGEYSSGGYYAETGLTNWETNKLFFKLFGKCVPSGTCYSVGLGGHIAGGGYGALSRLHGLTIDSLTGVEVVTVAEDNTVSTDVYMKDDPLSPEKAELFWAHTGGGGGNFGIITKYIFATLPDAPKLADITRIAVSWTNITNVDIFKSIVNLYTSSLAGWSNNLYCAANFNHKNIGSIDFDIRSAFDTDAEGDVIYSEINKFYTDLQGLGVNPYSTNGPGNGVQRLNWLDSVEVTGAIIGGNKFKYKSCYMRGAFPDNHLNRFYEYLNKDVVDLVDSSPVEFYANIQMNSYGGAINNFASGDTVSPQRDSLIKLQYLMSWKQMKSGSEGFDAACLDWINKCYAAVYENFVNKEPDNRPGYFNLGSEAEATAVDGCYVGYIDKDLTEWQYLYYGDNYSKLQQVKTRWDPQNLFNFGQSIEPA